MAIAPLVRHGDADPRPGTAGRILDNCEVRVVDPETGSDVPPDQDGEIWLRTPQRTPGYWRRPDETAAAITADGWFRTGDIGAVDADGYLFIRDRLKDMIISGGENIYSVKVEAAVSSHPDVVEVAVYGVPHPHWGETVKAVVVRRPGSSLTAEELLDHLSDRLARYKRPRLIEFADGLPKTGSGKILKRALRDGDAPMTEPAEVAPVRAGRGARLATASRPTCARSIAELDGPFSVLQFPNGSANLTYLVAFGDTRARRTPAAVRPARARRPRHAARVPRPVARCGARFDRAPRAYVTATTTTSSARTSSSSSTAAASSSGTTSRPSMAAHADVGRRIGLRRRRRARRPAPGRRRRRAASATSAAGRLRRAAGGGLAQALGPRRHRRRVAADGDRGRPRWPPRCRGADPGVGAAQRLQDRQLPVRPGRPRPRHAVFDWDMATLGDPLVDLGTLLNYWPDPSDVDDARPIARAGHGGARAAHPGRGGRPLRRPHRPRRRRRSPGTRPSPAGRRASSSSSCTSATSAARAPTRAWATAGPSSASCADAA